MSETSVQDRLRQHAKSFDGLLSLIPAKDYYGNGEDTSEQWRKQGQSKEEKRAARLANLDPENELNKSVKEVMEERARNKRKLHEMQKNTHGADVSDRVEQEIFQPGTKKKQKRSGASEPVTETHVASSQERTPTEEQRPRRKTGQRRERRETPRQDGCTTHSHTAQETPSSASITATETIPKQDEASTFVSSLHRPEDSAMDGADEVGSLDFSGLNPEEDAPGQSSPQISTPESPPGSPTFDLLHPAQHASAEPASTTTSISSTVPPSEKPKHIKIPADTSALRARLAARIAELRAARKADVDGKPIRTRQELIESRRVKEAERKAHKKELRRQAKLQEEARQEEALASARTSPGSMLSPLIGVGSDEDGVANQFAFGRVAFVDGTQLSHDLSYVKPDKKKTGPAGHDHKSQLAVLQAQKKRFADLDEDKRKQVLEKETWLSARRRAEGDRIQDNEAFLKKAVRRKENSKKKSEREWKERAKGVEKAIKDKQKKRDDNIQKRKEDKMLGKGKKKGAKVRRGRAGFEGSSGVRRNKNH